MLFVPLGRPLIAGTTNQWGVRFRKSDALYTIAGILQGGLVLKLLAVCLRVCNSEATAMTETLVRLCHG